MEVIASFRDLEKYGIVFLTGESCRQMYRILCDLTRNGKNIVEQAFGFKIESENWNRGSESDPHVASIMLAHESITQIAVYCLLPKYKWVVILENGAVFGVKTDEELQNMKEFFNSSKNIVVRQIRGYTNETRNVHQMSGRIA